MNFPSEHDLPLTEPNPFSTTTLKNLLIEWITICVRTLYHTARYLLVKIGVSDPEEDIGDLEEEGESLRPALSTQTEASRTPPFITPSPSPSPSPTPSPLSTETSAAAAVKDQIGLIGGQFDGQY